MPRNPSFAGDKKVGSSLLSRLETKFKLWAVPKLPRWIETHHLTFLTGLWSAVNVAVGLLIKTDLRWLYVVSCMICLQYVTDLFDGELGRQRKTGLVKWGFYMDHFLDYVFLCSLAFVGYMLSPEGLEVWYFALLAISGAYMINTFLSFAATNEFVIVQYGIGPTEVRIIFLLVNSFIIHWGTEFFFVLLPVTTAVCALGVVINTVSLHKQLWRLDMANKAREEKR